MSCFAGSTPPLPGRLSHPDRLESQRTPADFAAVSGRSGERAAAGLSLRMSAPGEFRIAVCCPQGQPLLEFGPFGEDEIVSVWRAMSERSGLPFVVAAEPDIAAAAPAAAPIRTAPDRRKRLAVLGARRPRFLCRRKTARLPRSPLVHRDREIAPGSVR